VASHVCECEVERDLYVPRMATITKIDELTQMEKLFRLEMNDGVGLAQQPGQFVQVCCFGIGEAPISMASMDDSTAGFDLCVRNVGNVTAALHTASEGSIVGIRGPYGRGFDTEDLKGNDILIVAGGIGMVPLRSLIQALLTDRQAYGAVSILYGFKTPAEMLFAEEVGRWSELGDVDVHLTVDRPHPDWDGHVGVVTTLFPELSIKPNQTKAIIVGPPIMYQFVITEARLKGIADEDMILSLERHMKCGVGKCGHCQINSKYVCLDGPVFTYSELKYMWEAI